MRNIKALIKKDLYEYKGNSKRIAIYLILVICIPIFAFNYGEVAPIFILDTSKFMNVLIILYMSLALCETSLHQTQRNIRDGIHEKYFINKRLRKYEIYLSKFITNLVGMLIAFSLMYVLNCIWSQFSSGYFELYINLDTIIQIFIACSITTSMSFITALVIDNAKNALVYCMAVALIYVFYYKLVELLDINNYLFEIIGLIVVAIILIVIVMYLLNSKKLIKKR